MSDLTRRVLEAQKHHGTGAYTTRYTEPTLTCANAAPTLARQVEAVEALADELERLATWERTPPAGPPASSPYADGLDVAAARIRNTLIEAKKGSTP